MVDVEKSKKTISKLSVSNIVFAAIGVLTGLLMCYLTIGSAVTINDMGGSNAVADAIFSTTDVGKYFTSNKQGLYGLTSNLMSGMFVVALISTIIVFVLNILVLIFSIVIIKQHNNPDKVNKCYKFSFANIFFSFFCFNLINFVLTIINTVKLKKLKQSAK